VLEKERQEMTQYSLRHGIGVTLLAFSLIANASAQGQESIRVVTTIPDLADLARIVGGDLVEASALTKGPEDPHFSQPKPSYIKALSEADALIVVGMDLEIGYVPVLLRGARNARVLPGAPGYIDASVAIDPMDVPQVAVDRSMGDVHAQGNPHYLVDPINGIRVAKLLMERFSTLRPAHATRFASGYEGFRRRAATALVGDALAAKYDIEQLMQLADLQRLDAFLTAQNDLEKLGGWLGRLRPFAGTAIVSDHRLWPYFARRFGLRVFADMEPVPGVPPSTRHLQELVERMRESSVKIILTSPYYDPRHARFLAEASDASIVKLTHQVGGAAGADDYLAAVDYNVRALASVLESRR